MEKYDKNSNQSYALGTTLTFELLKRKGEKATRIYISPKQKRDETYSKLVTLAKSLHLPVVENNEKIFKALSDKDNCMVIGEFKKWEEDIPTGNHVVLVNPSNLGNLGTILRSCAAFQIDGLAIIRPAADVFDPKCIRSSMGAVFSLSFKYYLSFEDYLKEFPHQALYPFMLQTDTYLGEEKKNAPYSLIFGNEATGLPAEFRNVGTPVKIPQSSTVDSLNLDNAVSIGLYEYRNVK